jgi:NAD(P)-dependent dehydrogenase (short-subunit alcohol dehydrogenase family)
MTAETRPIVRFDFSGKVVLVTGVARTGQIGHAVGEAFGRAGAKLVAADRNAVAVAERVREFKAMGIDARPAAGDLTEADIAALAVETAIKHYGRLDVLVNVAGGLVMYGPLAETPPDVFDRQLAINLKTAYLMSRASLVPLGQSRGCIVNFASIAVFHPGPGLVAYSAAKAGVAGFTRSLAAEMWPQGVRVNAVAPATVRTAENVATGDENAQYVEMRDIVNAVMFLASDGAAAITGHVLPVTNGL